MKNKYDILNIEWISSGRDINIVEPVLCYLEKQGLSVLRTSYLGALGKLVYYNPNMIVLSNNVGSIRNYIVSKFAYLFGIKVVTLSSEGDYCIIDHEKNTIESFFWGWDLDQEFPVDLHLEWSNKNIDLIKKYVKNSDYVLRRTKISGATGFDRYILLSFKNKDEFLKKNKKDNFTMIVGYAAWGFDLLYDNRFLEAATFQYSKDYITFHKKNRDLLKKELNLMISRNPNVLFILKRHPGELIYNETELAGLEDYNNVIMIKSEETIEDLINVCDIWAAYESTTCMEAWLLGKQTVLINPIKFTDKRSDISFGSPIRSTYGELQNDIDAGEVVGFDCFENKRKELVKRIIEYDDGENHVRAANYIIEEFGKETARMKKINTWMIRQLIKEFLKMIIFYSFFKRLPFFKDKVKDYVDYAKRYSVQERNEYIKKYREAIDLFDK